MKSYPVVVKQKKKKIVFDTDEDPRESTPESLGKLGPAFKRDGGTVTAGNASGINDGAAAFVVMSADKAKEMGLKPLFRIVSYASGGVDPKVMGIGPVPASQKALAKAGLTVADLDLIEANEAFAAQSIAVGRDMGMGRHGESQCQRRAVAIGHPIGASGARILVTLCMK